MGKIIILGSEKGGVAKTTSTFNLACGLPVHGAGGGCGSEYPGRRRDGYLQDGEIYRKGLLYRCAGEGWGRV